MKIETAIKAIPQRSPNILAAIRTDFDGETFRPADKVDTSEIKKEIKGTKYH